MRAQSIVVQVQMLERHVGGKEGDEWRLRVEPKGIIVQIDRGKFGKVKDRCQERREGLRNLIKQAAGKDISEVRNLRRSQLKQQLEFLS